MKRFERGSVTVFLTLILIPTIIITAVFMDMSRIRLFSNQAIMAADNYAEGVLTEYDNLLKELYGVFAVTQDKAGIEAINDLREYMKTSFDPSGKVINFGHLAGVLDKDIDGFMPYRPKEAEEGVIIGKDESPYYDAVEGANLANPYVLGTQIGDFMRYRILDGFNKDNGEESGGVLDTLDSLKSVEADTAAAKEMEKVMDKASDILEKQKNFYNHAKNLNEDYYKYLRILNKSYQIAKDGGDKSELEKLVPDSSKLAYYRFNKDYPFDKDEATSKSPQGMISLVDGEYKDYFKSGSDDLAEPSDSVPMTEEEAKAKSERLVKEGKKKSQIKDELNWYADSYSDLYSGTDSKFFGTRIENYENSAKNLESAASNLISSFEDFNKAIKVVETKLGAEDVSENMRENMQSTLDQYKKLSENPGEYSDIAKHFTEQTGVNGEFRQSADKINNYLIEFRNYYLNKRPGTKDIDIVYETKLKSFKMNGENVGDIQISSFNRLNNNKLYESLKATFDGTNYDADNLKKTAEDKEKAAKKAQEDLEKEDENIGDLKIIPDSFELEDTGNTFLPGLISDFFKSGALDTQLAKIYTISYDLGMFSNRIDRELRDDKGDRKSLTGYDMSKLNYIYGAELEYLLNGSRNPKENLNSTRNKILAFRAGINLASTFVVKEINEPINKITAKLMGVNPVVAVVVNAALRAGATAIETVADWKLLKEGKKVALMKTRFDDLSAKEVVVNSGIDAVNKQADNIPGTSGGGKSLHKDINPAEAKKNAAKSIKLDYNQYVNIMLLVFVDTDTLVKRTGNLICINVNNAINNGNLDSQEFTLKNAVTAVKGTSSVHFNFLMLPNGFGGGESYGGMGAFSRKVVDEDTYNKMKEIEKNRYKFSVIRGY